MIPVYRPWRALNQVCYVNECLHENMLSYRGRFVWKMEQELKKFLVPMPEVILTANGTVSLYAIYHCLGLKGETVVTSTMTYAATVNQLLLVGARVVLLDCDQNLQMNLDHLEEYLRTQAAVHRWTNRGFPKAVVVPEVYGDSPDLNRLKRLSGKYQFHLIEDSAESMCCRQHGETMGSWGEAGSFSFFANKLVTTGEGGCVLTRNHELAERVRGFINQHHDQCYEHTDVGTNFRMSNLQAAVGCAQLEDLNLIITAKQKLARRYRQDLAQEIGRVIPKSYSTEWMPVFTLPDGLPCFRDFFHHCHTKGVEIRPIFHPIHLQPWAGRSFIPFPMTVSESIALQAKHFILPSSPDLSEKEYDQVVQTVNDYVRERQ